jgi:hypothetical protein
MKKSTQKSHVILKLKKNNMGNLHTRAWAIYNGMRGSPTLFPAASPPLPALLTQLTAFDNAQMATVEKTLSSYPVRNLDAETLVTSLESERMYVQGLCNASPEQAASLAASAGMFLAKIPARNKPVLSVTSAVGSGAAILDANAGLLKGKTSRRSFFGWRGSPDGGKTWVVYPPTALSKTGVSGLTPLTEWSFQVNITIGSTTGPWSQAVSCLIR